MKFSFEGTQEEWQSFCSALGSQAAIQPPAATPVQKVREVKKETVKKISPVSSPQEFTKHQMLGKRNMTEMLKMWVTNLGIKGSDQPNRAEYVTEISKDGKHCGSVISYAMACGGLTVAVDNCLREIDTRTTPEFSRKVAANIAQVTSILLPPLAQQYELKNPLQ